MLLPLAKKLKKLFLGIFSNGSNKNTQNVEKKSNVEIVKTKKSIEQKNKEKIYENNKQEHHDK